MFRIFSYITIAAIGLVLLFNFIYSEGSRSEDPSPSNPAVPCKQPLTYKIGSIDSRFKITAYELKLILKDAEDLWENALDRDLMNFKENGDVVVHLIYGENQKRTENEQDYSKRIRDINEIVSQKKKEHERLSEDYNALKKELQEKVAHYKQVVDRFNEYVKSWNQKGGIPPSKKPTIEAQKRKIRSLENELKRMEQRVESKRQELNSTTRRLNNLVDHQNKLINQYNQQFAETRKFNQGKYIRQGDDERINIYQFRNRGELKAVLVHEMGHAMGIGHVENSKSIMFELMGDQDIFNLSLTEEDVEALRQQCDNF